MAAQPASGTYFYPVKEFDQIIEFRAARHQHLRGRNNVTSCRSPPRDLNTWQIKKDLKQKREQEFMRRRSVSPQPPPTRSPKARPSRVTSTMKHLSSFSNLETLYADIQTTPPANGRPRMKLPPDISKTDGPSTSKWASAWSEQVTLTRQEHSPASSHESTSTPTMKESKRQTKKSTEKRETSVNAQRTSIKTVIQTEKIHQKFSTRNENTLQKKTLRENGVQTESGLVTVKESDIKLLADSLQEALWREQAVKTKLALLQETVANLVNSSDEIWTARCSEDLLRNKIKALEAQLQVCLQKFPKDGVKKLLLQMEKQKLVYEEKALIALQKATQEKTEALTKSEMMKEALISAKTEALRWQSLYEELRVSSGQLMDKQLQQLHGQVELSRAREAELRDEVVSLTQEKRELQYNIRLLEEDNQMLREEIQDLRDGSAESQAFVMQEVLSSAEAEAQQTTRRDSQAEEQLRKTQEKLRLKERECEELQTELHVMEQECQSSQARLSQCRDELRQVGHRHKRRSPCGSWWKVLMFFLFLLLVVAQVAMLWMWYPPFREQAEDLYDDIETRIKDYLMEMASPRHSGCFRPI